MRLFSKETVLITESFYFRAGWVDGWMDEAYVNTQMVHCMLLNLSWPHACMQMTQSDDTGVFCLTSKNLFFPPCTLYNWFTIDSFAWTHICECCRPHVQNFFNIAPYQNPLRSITWLRSRRGWCMAVTSVLIRWARGWLAFATRRSLMCGPPRPRTRRLCFHGAEFEANGGAADGWRNE